MEPTSPEGLAPGYQVGRVNDMNGRGQSDSAAKRRSILSENYCRQEVRSENSEVESTPVALRRF